jgi:hypothetical protein
MQQVAPWASSAPPAQGRSPVDAGPKDATSCESEAGDATWSPFDPLTSPEVAKISISSKTIQRLRLHIANCGSFLRRHVLACDI